MKTVIKKWLPAPKNDHETIEISDPLELLEKYVTGFEDESGKFLIVKNTFSNDKYYLLHGKNFTCGSKMIVDDILVLLAREESTIHTFQDYEEAVKWVNKDE
ncbi:MAG TPA: hypothetical protein VJ945_01395 [Flavobacteriaceae bacterium]|nr:hypothetical protein [Flavobacteriaceae bacterium]